MLSTIYCCPACHGDLKGTDNNLVCFGCGSSYDRISGVPVLISAGNPIFGSADLSNVESAGFRKPLLHRLGRWIPSPSLDLGPRQWLRTLARQHERGTGICFIIGAGDDTKLVARLREQFAEVIVSDVVLGPGVDLICDGAELPLRSGSIDCIFAIAVLEHVLAPQVVVSEMNRVLRDGAMVVADTPFMQPVHMRQYDFTRFTDLGYRWLFRSFDEVERGVSVGPASALVWALMYLFRSLGWSRGSALALATVARLAFFWIKYLDFLVAGRRAAGDGAAGIFFVGRKRRNEPMDAGSLLQQYRGY